MNDPSQPSSLASFKEIPRFIPNTLGHSLLNTSKSGTALPGLPCVVGLPGIAAMPAYPVPPNRKDCPIWVVAEVICMKMVLEMLRQA